MGIVRLPPTADDSGWLTGSFADIDEGIANANDGDFISETAFGTAMLLDFADGKFKDADVINTITVDIRVRCDRDSLLSTMNVALFINAVQQGVVVDVPLTIAFTSLIGLSLADWNGDRTAAEMNSMQLQINTTQVGAPTVDLWQVSAVDVVVDADLAFRAAWAQGANNLVKGVL